MSDSPSTLKLSDKWYDILKFIAQIVLPALGTLYATIAAIWGLPAAEQVVATIVAVDTFLGILLGISTKKYLASGDRYDGTVDAVPEDGGIKPVFNLDEHPVDSIEAGKKELVLKINPHPAQFDSPPKP